MPLPEPVHEHAGGEGVFGIGDPARQSQAGFFERVAQFRLAFVEFQPHDGERTFIAKSALHCVTPTNVPPAADLWAGPTQGADFDPYAILGIDASSTREHAREAYLKLAKAYHPDRYAATDLPREVRDYLAVMVRRINAAHDALQAKQRHAAKQEDPVFAKAGQGH